MKDVETLKDLFSGDDSASVRGGIFIVLAWSE